MINVHFTADQYSKKDHSIETKMTRSFWLANIQHKVDNGQRAIQKINVISPSGVQMEFELVGEHGGGLRYINGNINLNLLNP